VIDQAADHPALRGCSVTVASEPLLQRAPQLPAAWNAARQAAVAQISADWPAYYRFHAQVSGFPQASIEASYTAQQFQPEAFPASGLQLLQGTKEFLLEQRLIRRDFDIQQWTI
jgi:NitT/TauT family transport system substrate-binding protein/sulfonate transport system substrate-binding protein